MSNYIQQVTASERACVRANHLTLYHSHHRLYKYKSGWIYYHIILLQYHTKVYEIHTL